jgi:hypothetical protein
MRTITLLTVLIFITSYSCSAQRTSVDQTEIRSIIDRYSKSVIARDCTAFYDLFKPCLLQPAL